MSTATEKRGPLLQYPKQPYTEPLTDKHLNVSVLLAALRRGQQGPGYSEAELQSLASTTGSTVRMQLPGSNEACGLVESVHLNSEGDLIGSISIDPTGRKEIERLLSKQGMAFLQVVIGRHTSSRGRQDASDRVLRVEIVDGKSDTPDIRASASASSRREEIAAIRRELEVLPAKVIAAVKASEARQRASLGERGYDVLKRLGYL